MRLHNTGDYVSHHGTARCRYPVYLGLDKMDNESAIGINSNKRLLIELRKIDWGKYVEYGTVEIHIRKGKAFTLAVKTTEQF